MAILKKDELFTKIKSLIGDDSSDETLAILEDFQDTVNDYEDRSKEDWRTKYEQNDSEWRAKYKERFFNSDSVDNKKDITGDIEDKKIIDNSIYHNHDNKNRELKNKKNTYSIFHC